MPLDLKVITPVTYHRLHEREVAPMGSDTCNDKQPSPYDRFRNPVHQVGNFGMGLWVLGNAWLDDLATACAA